VFDALGRLINAGHLRANECDVRFIGAGGYSATPEVHRSIEAAGLTASITFLPRVPYEQALLELMDADVLLLLQASQDTVDLIPAKLYEYLRAQKPVLALVWQGAVTKIMQQTGGGWAVDPRLESDLDASLLEAISAWRSGSLARHCAPLDTLRRFDRRSLSAELAQIFDSATNRRTPAPANAAQSTAGS
jgi:hypothetical protein